MKCTELVVGNCIICIYLFIVIFYVYFTNLSSFLCYVFIILYNRTNRVMAVKRIRSTVDEKEQKQLLMDLEVVMKSNECLYIVQFYGALFKEVSIKVQLAFFVYKYLFQKVLIKTKCKLLMFKVQSEFLNW